MGTDLTDIDAPLMVHQTVDFFKTFHVHKGLIPLFMQVRQLVAALIRLPAKLRYLPLQLFSPCWGFCHCPLQLLTLQNTAKANSAVTMSRDSCRCASWERHWSASCPCSSGPLARASATALSSCLRSSTRPKCQAKPAKFLSVRQSVACSGGNGVSVALKYCPDSCGALKLLTLQGNIKSNDHMGCKSVRPRLCVPTSLAWPRMERVTQERDHTCNKSHMQRCIHAESSRKYRRSHRQSLSDYRSYVYSDSVSTENLTYRI